jgi:tetratricopeptide (TPR) repeat protein
MSQKRVSSIAAGLCLVIIVTGLQAADAPADNGGSALAWRLDAISSEQLGPTQPPGAWRRSAALLEAAGRLNPTEPRFPRLRVLAVLHLGDTDAAIAALRAYRALAPADRVAQAQLIDLYAAKLETVDAKVKYLDGLLDKQDIPVEVRSHVAAQCASLLIQKSRDQAAEMARRAVALYPLPAATTLYYDLAGRELPLKERVAALLDVLKSNPNQPVYLEELATLLAGVGLSEESLPWYAQAIGVIMRSSGTRPPEFHNLLIDYAAEQMIAGHSSAADTLLGQMLDELPLDPDAWFLKLSIGQSSAGPVAYKQTLELARSAMVRRWNAVADEILNGPAATQPATGAQPPPAGAQQPDAGAAQTQPAATEPAAVAPLDPEPIIEKLKTGSEQQKRSFFFVVADLAWFELYFDKQPDAAKKWIDALATTPVEPVVLDRLRGWLALQSDPPQLQQAETILAKVADRDALAELGLIRAEKAQTKPVDEPAVTSLLDKHRVGLIGAILWSALRTDKTTPATQPASQGLAEELVKFPKPLLEAMDARGVRRLYEVRVEPVAANVGYGDPILLRVTVTNTGDADITIGAGALLRPDLWFDAQILGLNQHAFRGVSYDQIVNELVLRAGVSTSQIVRLDAGELYDALRSLPASSTRMSGDVITNPVVLSSGVLPGPAGLSSSFGRSVLYSGVLLTQPTGKKAIDAALESNDPADRLRALDVLAAYISAADRQGATEELKKLVADLPQSITRMRTNASPAVAGWASYLAATLASGEAQGAIVGEMSRSTDWTTRLLSLLVPGPSQREVAARLAAGDPDATVKSTATATVEFLEQAATQPTSQPAATQPANVGG